MAALRTTLELAARNILLLLRPIPKRNDGAARSGGGGLPDDGRKQTTMGSKIGIKQIGDVLTCENTGSRSHFSTAFPRAYPPFPFPIPPQTTMADAAEHDEELVDYDEEEVG